jgi:hypothetical protein
LFLFSALRARDNWNLPRRRQEFAVRDRKKLRGISDDFAELLGISESLGIALSEESEFVKDMLAEHPEYVEDFSTGAEREGMNPRLHIVCEAVVQAQIASNDPPEARQAHLALMSEPSLDAHQARHAIGSVLMETIWHALREKWEPDQMNSYYRNRLRRLAERKLDDQVFR